MSTDTTERPPTPPLAQADEVKQEEEKAEESPAKKTKDETAETVKVEEKETKKDPALLTQTEQLKLIFPESAGYRYTINPKWLTLTASKMSDKKKKAKAEKYGGRESGDSKERFVNVNSLFRTFPKNEKILSKFLPKLNELKEPHKPILISAACKSRYCRMTGWGTSAKEQWKTDKNKSKHEFSLTPQAFREDSVTEDGKDPHSLAQFEMWKTVWGHLSGLIIDSTKIAEKFHTECSKLVGAQNEKETDEQYRERFRATYIKTFIKPVDEGCVKFDAPMVGMPTEEELKEFEKKPYTPPAPHFLDVYEVRNVNDRVIYRDLPVIRPKTDAELRADEEDDNPFIYVPFDQREGIDGGILAPVYEIGVTEDAKEKSHFKPRPLLVIWFKDDCQMSPLAMDISWRKPKPVTEQSSSSSSSSSTQETSAAAVTTSPPPPPPPPASQNEEQETAATTSKKARKRNRTSESNVDKSEAE